LAVLSILARGLQIPNRDPGWIFRNPANDGSLKSGKDAQAL